METYNRTTTLTATGVALRNEHSEPPLKMIPDYAMVYFTTYALIVLLILVSSLGMTANVINIFIYWSNGFKESVNITFLALSVWDLNVCFFTNLHSICFTIDIYFPVPSVQATAILYVYIAYTKGFMYVLSTIATVYLSVERCICIMFPFKVKGIFTVPRVMLVNLIITMFGLVCFCPAWATQGLKWDTNPWTNKTLLVPWVSAYRRYIDLFTDTFNGMVIPLVAQLLISLTAGFMIQRINKSKKFRQLAISPLKLESVPEVSSVKDVKSKLVTRKDLKLTKVVILLSLIFFICNLPVFIVAFLRALIPEIDVGKSQVNLYTVLYFVVYLVGAINSSVNIIVYYHVSTKYRYHFRSLFGLSNYVITYH